MNENIDIEDCRRPPLELSGPYAYSTARLDEFQGTSRYPVNTAQQDFHVGNGFSHEWQPLIDRKLTAVRYCLVILESSQSASDRPTGRPDKKKSAVP